jgi:hypothetical protein
MIASLDNIFHVHCSILNTISFLCQDHGVTSAVTVTTVIQREGSDRCGHASPVTVIRMLTPMLLGTVTEPLASA